MRDSSSFVILVVIRRSREKGATKRPVILVVIQKTGNAIRSRKSRVRCDSRPLRSFQVFQAQVEAQSAPDLGAGAKTLFFKVS